jgi:hypothetical protein
MDAIYRYPIKNALTIKQNSKNKTENLHLIEVSRNKS